MMEESAAPWMSPRARRANRDINWYQRHAKRTLSLIHSTGLPRDAAILDVGGGTASLAADLLEHGFNNLTVLDRSEEALRDTQRVLGVRAILVDWVTADVCSASLRPASIDLWHDRSVFAILKSIEDRRRYLLRALEAVKVGGYIILAVAGDDQTEDRSGVRENTVPLPFGAPDASRSQIGLRGRPDELSPEFRDAFVLRNHEREIHVSSGSSVQQVFFCYSRRPE